jgi:TonB family protein
LIAVLPVCVVLLAGGATSVVGQVMVSAPLPRLTKEIELTYPAEAVGTGASGWVLVQITVGTNGRVTDPKILRSDAAPLDAAAMATARQMEFDASGLKAPVTGTVSLFFRPPADTIAPRPSVGAKPPGATSATRPGVKPPPIRSAEELTPKPAPEPTVVIRRVATTVPVWRYRPTLGQVIISNLTNAVRSIGAANLELAQINLQITNARAHYWKAFPSGPDFATAEAEFSRLLWAKDGWYLMWALPEGKRSPMKDPDEITSGLDVLKRVTLPLDDGIRPQASTTFDDLVAAMRYEMGVRRANDIAPTFVPGKTMAALRASSDKLEAYLRARDWAEFLASGIDIRKFFEPKTYALQLVEDRILQESWGAGIKRPSPESEAARVYSAMVETVGEPGVLAAAAKVLAAEQKHGRLVKPMSITSIEGSLSVTSPRRAFESLLFSEPRGAAVFAVMGTGIYAQRWEDALAGYRELVAKYGEKSVLSAAAQVLKAEKSPLGLIEHRRPGWWLGQLLEKPGLPLPGPIPRLAVSDIEGLKAAVGRTVVATGTVSHVIEESGGGALRYLRVHFKEGGGLVSARIIGFVPTFEGRYGDRGANIVGKTIEVTSDFWVQPEGILLRVTDIAQIKVVK